MNLIPTLALTAMSTPETRNASPLATLPDVAAPLDAWGSCEIRLIADRVSSLSTGSTHKVYRGWRFAAVMQPGHSQPETTLFTVAIDPGHLAASRSRYALIQLPPSGAMVAGDPVAFSWSASSIGTADPFAAALAQARRQLAATGWTQDVSVSTHYTKTEPTTLVGAMTAKARAVSEDGLAMTTTAAPAVTGLDGWETDGGTAETIDECSPRLQPGGDC